MGNRIDNNIKKKQKKIISRKLLKENYQKLHKK